MLSTKVIPLGKIDVEATGTFGAVSKIISVANFVPVNKYVLFSSSTIFPASGLDKVKFKIEVTQGHVSHIQLLNSSSFPCKIVSRRVIELTMDFTESLTFNNSSVVLAVFKAA